MTTARITAIIPMVLNCLLRYAFAPCRMALQTWIILSLPFGYLLTEMTSHIAASTPTIAIEVVRRRGSKAMMTYLVIFDGLFGIVLISTSVASFLKFVGLLEN